jgi:hypothetical protein
MSGFRKQWFQCNRTFEVLISVGSNSRNRKTYLQRRDEIVSVSVTAVKRCCRNDVMHLSQSDERSVSAAARSVDN